MQNEIASMQSKVADLVKELKTLEGLVLGAVEDRKLYEQSMEEVAKQRKAIEEKYHEVKQKERDNANRTGELSELTDRLNLKEKEVLAREGTVTTEKTRLAQKRVEIEHDRDALKNLEGIKQIAEAKTSELNLREKALDDRERLVNEKKKINEEVSNMLKAREAKVKEREQYLQRLAVS